MSEQINETLARTFPETHNADRISGNGLRYDDNLLTAYDWPAYSSDISWAWKIVTALRDRDFSVSVGAFEDHFSCAIWSDADKHKSEPTVHVSAETAELAICQAALELGLPESD